jgi:hypothetical protein
MYQLVENKMQQIRRTFIVSPEGVVYGLNTAALRQAEIMLNQHPNSTVQEVIALVAPIEPELTGPSL